MEVAHIHVEVRKYSHCFFNGSGNIVELEVKEDLMTSCFDFTNDRGTFRIEKFHTDLYVRLSAREFIKKIVCSLCACKVASNDNVFSHGSDSFLPLGG